MAPNISDVAFLVPVLLQAHLSKQQCKYHMESMPHVEVVQKLKYVAQAKEKVADALKAMQKELQEARQEEDQEARQEEDGAFDFVNQTMYYLQAAKGLLEDEKCFEELETVVMFLALSMQYMQGTRGARSSKVKNPLRDAMMLIAVSNRGHNRDGIITLLESAGLQMDHITSSQTWKCYHDLMKDEEGYHLKPNKRPRKGTSKKKKEFRARFRAANS